MESSRCFQLWKAEWAPLMPISFLSSSFSITKDAQGCELETQNPEMLKSIRWPAFLLIPSEANDRNNKGPIN